MVMFNDALLPSAAHLPMADASLVQQRALTTRRDWKFLLPQDALGDLLQAWRSTHSVVPAGTRVWARYRTQYVDTEGFASYRDHAQRKVHRYKYRFRDYLDRHLSFFEVKERRPTGHTAKQRTEVPFASVDLDLARRVARERWIDVDRVTLDVRFLRLMLVHRERPERVTVDVGLQLIGAREVALSGVAVVEVKSGRTARFTQSLAPIRGRRHRATPFSKYCLGLALCEPGVNPAPFRRMIKRVEALCL